MKRKLIAVLVFLGILLLCLPALADTKLISTQSDLIYFLQGGGTGELQADVKLSQTVELTREGDLTWLDLKGHTLTLDQGAQLIIKSGSMTLMSSGGSKGVLTNGGLSNEDGLIHVHENSTLTLVYVNVFGADGYAQQVIHNEGILQLETDAYVRGYSQATIENTGSGMVAVTDSTVESLTNYTCCAIRSSSTADHAVVIKENALITSAAWAREPYLGTITLTGDRADVTALSVEGGTVTNTARSGGACIINTGAGTVSLSGGAVTTAAAYSIAVIGSGSGKTEVSGGSVEATGQNSYAMRCDGPVYVTDGSIKATGMAATALEPRGELYVTGGEISVTASDSNAHALWLGNNQSKRVISGGTVTSPGTTIILAFNQLLTISGTGIVESTGGLAIDMYLGSTLTITGGTVRNTGTGSAINSTSNCKLSITGGTVQTKTGTAINGSSGGLIEIGGDALITATDTVKNLIAITTSTGYTSEVLKITGGTITCAGTNQVIVSNGGKITIAGGSILNTIKNAYNIAVVRVDGDTQLDITGGLIRATDGQAFAVILNTTAQVTMSGGDIIADREDGSNYGVHMNQSAASTFTMTGGTITANGPFSTGVSVSGGSFTLQGGTIKAPGKDGYGCCVGAGTVSLRNGTLEGGYAALSAFSTPNEYLVAPGMVLRGGVQAVLEAPSVMAEGLLTQLSTAYDGSGAALGDLRTVDLSTIKYVRTVTDKSTITAEDVTISGTVGQPMDTTITMKLAGDTFAQNLSGAWLVNVPAGVTQTVTRVDDTTAAIRLTGTPTAACSEVVAGVVPLACLENTIVDVTLTANDSAKWSIVWPTITAQVGNVTVSGTIGTAMTETTVSVTITGSTFAEALSGTWITNAPAGITQTLTRVNDTTATITLIGTPAAGSTAALNVVIPASCLRNAQDDVTCGANANAKWAIGTATTATPAPTPTATPTPTPTATATATPTPTPTPTATATPTAAPTPTATPTATLVITVSIAPGNTFVQGQAGQAYIVTVEAGIPGFSAANNFVRATMDGHALNVGTVGAPGTDGSVADGSIILTLNEQYLNTLNVGKHMLSVEIKDAGGKRQTVTTTLTVTAPMTPPKTGDSTNLSLLLLLMGISMSAAILLGRRRFAKEK